MNNRAVPNTSDTAQAILKGTWETVGLVKPFKGDPTLGDFRESVKARYTIGTGKSERSVRFKEYTPSVFRRLRALFGVDAGDYLYSMGGGEPLYSLPSMGKSGAAFYYTHDGGYIIKSMKHSEAILLRRLLPAYYSHFVRHPHTLISRYFALFRLDLGSRREYYCVMNNVFDSPRDLHVSAVYDLKGSTYSRITSTEKRARGAVMKDLDFLELGHRVRLTPNRRALLLRQLQIDSDFLASLGLIDYSLLLGIHEFEATTDHNSVFRSPEEASPGAQAGEGAQEGEQQQAQEEEQGQEAVAADALANLDAEDTLIVATMDPAPAPAPATPTAHARSPSATSGADEMWVCTPLVVGRGSMSPAVKSRLAAASSTASTSTANTIDDDMPHLMPFRTASAAAAAAATAAAAAASGTANDALNDAADAAAVAYAAAQRARAVRTAGDTDPVLGFSLGDLTNPSASLFAPSSWVAGEAGDNGGRHSGLRSVFQCEDGGLRSESGHQVYFFGVIDLLTPYTSRKRIERRLKRIWQGEGVSVAPPAFFAERFVHFARDKVLAPLAIGRSPAVTRAPDSHRGRAGSVAGKWAPAALRRMSVAEPMVEMVEMTK